MSPFAYLIIGIAIACAGFIALSMLIYYFGTREGRNRLRQSWTRPTSLADVRDSEFTKLVGHLRLAGPAQQAPFSKRPCACFHLVVKERTGDNAWKVIIDSPPEACRFGLEDEHGCVMIEAESVQILIPPREVEMWFGPSRQPPEALTALLEEHGEEYLDMLGNPRRLALHESVIVEDRKVTVLGVTRVDPGYAMPTRKGKPMEEWPLLRVEPPPGQRVVLGVTR
jgi:hypothetical protein